MSDKNLAMAYAVKKRGQKMADGGAVRPPVDPEKAKRAESSMRKAFGYSDGGMCAHGSSSCAECHSDGDMVGRIMKSRGGMIANDSEPEADFESAEFDDLANRDELESSYTGANSGDEIGNSQEDDDRSDIVSRIMRSRSKKDRNPRPA